LSLPRRDLAPIAKASIACLLVCIAGCATSAHPPPPTSTVEPATVTVLIRQKPPEQRGELRVPPRVTLKDSDGDGVPDNEDQCPELPGPADNQGCPRKLALVEVRKDRIDIKQQLRFMPNRAALLADSYPTLQEVAQALKDAPKVRARVEGHTDSVGDRGENLALSQSRAETVRDYLVAQGVGADRLTAEGFGSTRPIAPNGTKAGRTLNRRVEIRLEETGGARQRGASDAEQR
jgi:outer membrane protein OmpA-like peptidoglycan-associated protein